jgi:hypothetical protein
MSGWICPPELRPGSSRRVRATFKVKVRFWAGIVGLALMAFLFLPVVYFSHAFKVSGVRAVAQVSELKVSAGRSGHYQVRYEFTPAGQSVRKAATVYVEQKLFARLRVGEAVPVVYLPQPPFISDLNIDNAVFSRNLLPFDLNASLSLLVLVFILLWQVTSATRAYRRERRLLQQGKAVAAKITDARRVPAGRGISQVALSYEFVDAAGKIVEDTSRSFMRKQSREAFGPTAVFDPGDSSRHLLYPGDYAVVLSD